MSRRGKKDFALFHSDKDGHLLIRRQRLSGLRNNYLGILGCIKLTKSIIKRSH